MAKQDLVLTTLKVIPQDWEKFQALAHSEGTSGAAMLRGLIRQALRRAEKAGK